MKVIVTARHVELTGEFKAYLTDKAAKLERFYDRILEVDAIVTKDSGAHEVEFIVRADHHNRFVAKERHADAYAAADLVIEHIERQLSRHKEKHRNRKHPGRENNHAPDAGEAAAQRPDED